MLRYRFGLEATTQSPLFGVSHDPLPTVEIPHESPLGTDDDVGQKYHQICCSVFEAALVLFGSLFVIEYALQPAQ